MAELPRPAGRPARIALLVFNDAHADSRVLKTAASLRRAGAEVRIFASARPLSGYPAGDDTAPDGTPIHRAEDFDLVRLMPRVARTWRGLRNRRRGIPASSTGNGVQNAQTSATSAHRSPDSVAQGAEGAVYQAPGAVHQAPGAVHRAPGAVHRAPGAVYQAQAVAADIWMRTYQAVRLGWFWLGTVREAAAWAPDVVHANDANTLVPAMALEALSGSSTVYDSHELWLRRNIRQDRWLAPHVEAVIERVGVMRAAGVITVSPSIARWLQDRYRLAEAPTLVRNIPAATGVLPDPAEGRLRELAGLAADQQVVAYAGGITTGRGLEETVEALALLPGSVHLVLLGYGDPGYLEGLLAHARHHGVARRVHLVGTVPGAEVPTALADADVSVVFVRPICLSYRYSLPNKLFESIHAGLPIVASDLPDTAEIVRAHGVGEVFDVSTPAELAEAISHVLTDPGDYRRAARKAAALLTWQGEESRLLALYARVLAGRAGAS